MKKTIKNLILSSLCLFGIHCSYTRPSIIEVVIPYVNDSGSTKKINIFVRYTTTNPSSDTIIWIGGKSNNSPVFGASTASAGSTTTKGRFESDFFGDPMFNITVPGTPGGRNAGVIRRKIPTVVGGDQLTEYQISQICDPLYDPMSLCQVQTSTNNFGPSDNFNGPQGIQNWKRIKMSWQYWDAASQGSLKLPVTISVDSLPPPDPQICHAYTYKTPGCWFSWPWGDDDCYFWCSSCYSTGQYCDPLTYSY